VVLEFAKFSVVRFPTWGETL